MSKQIGIAGMGWLGQPLAQHLIMLGYRVKGTATSEAKVTNLCSQGYDAHVLEISESGVTGDPKAFLGNLDVLVIMIPPGLRKNTGANYVLKMSHLLSEIQQAEIEHLILISSTSVYSDAQGAVTEKIYPIPDNEAGRQLLQVEQRFFNDPSQKTTLVRFGGLVGGSRQPVRYLAGRKELQNGAAPVNLIHRDDCIGILSEIIKQECFGKIFNAVAPFHPNKSDYYTNKAQELGLQPPEYVKTDAGGDDTYKKVDSVHLKSLLQYQFKQSIL
ncbi:MAG: SDR family oxidoreductase [Flavobacteriales bacterium]|jgi:nucleoside-diphosphate-sugar epimerase|nr:SDR family oxidoreductase [Flavobacteriales bacterium]